MRISERMERYIETKLSPEEIKVRLQSKIDPPVKWYQLRPPYERKPYEGVITDNIFSIESLEDKLKIEAEIRKAEDKSIITMEIINLANLRIGTKGLPQIMSSKPKRDMPAFQFAIVMLIVFLFVLWMITHFSNISTLSIMLTWFLFFIAYVFIVMRYDQYYKEQLNQVIDEHVAFFQQLFQ